MKHFLSVCLSVLFISCSADKSSDIIYIDLIVGSTVINGIRVSDEQVEQVISDELEKLKAQGYSKDQLSVNMMAMPSVRMARIVHVQTELRNQDISKINYFPDREPQEIDEGEIR